MSAGDLALIACIPGPGLMLLAAEASQKIKGPGLDLIRRTIASTGLGSAPATTAQSCGAPPPVNNKLCKTAIVTWQGWKAPGPCPAPRRALNGPCTLSPAQISGTAGRKT